MKFTDQEICKLSDIDFNDLDCPFTKEYCFEHENCVYEHLEHPDLDCMFRVVLAINDYDYIECEIETEKLLKVYNELKK